MRVGAGAQQPGAGSAPTFNRHVAPIVFANCVTCHRPGGIGPFSLMSYADAKPFVQEIKAKVGERSMPPWYADPKFGEFKNARGLTQAQIDTITAWVDAGAPEGDGAPPAPPKQQDTGWRAMNRPPDEILELPFKQFALPPQGEVPTFTVWLPPLRQERFVQAIEIRPSVPGAVHHSSLSLGRMPAGTRIGRGAPFEGAPEMDGIAVNADGQRFRSVGGEQIAEKPVYFFVPGGAPMQLPDGFGKRFSRTDFISWGLHLISPGKADNLRVEIGLWHARRYPRKEMRMWTVTETLTTDGGPVEPDASGNRVFPDIPAGAANWAMTGTRRITTDITLHALWPHMHYRGKDMTFVLTLPNGKQETLLSVPNYNPHWQIQYELARPMRIRRGSTITAYGHFNNSASNPHNPNPAAAVKFGEQGTDEMFLPFLEVTLDDEDLTLERFQPPPQ